MSDDHDDLLELRRRRRVRGWFELAIGLAAIAAGVVITIVTFDKAIARGGGSYLVAHGPVVAGFLIMLRGVLRLMWSDDDRHAMPTGETGPRRDLTVAFGFKSFVAWRYLMARSHRVSKYVFVVCVLALFLSGVGILLEHTLVTRANPAGLHPEMLKMVAQVVTGLKIGGFVLAFMTLIVGALRYVFSFFTTVPLVGVWIGTGALVCVLAVMSGFETDLRQKILGSNAHIQVTHENGDLLDWREVKARIDAVPGVLASTPYAVSEVVIAANNNGMNVIIKGIDPDTVGQVTKLVKSLDDPDALARLEPLVDDTLDRRVPVKAPEPGTEVVDPPPLDMPGIGDPIDFSAPPEPAGGAAPADDGDDAADDDDGAATPDYGGDAQYLVATEPVVDPPPDDFVSSDAPPIDFSRPDDDSSPIHVLDIPLETPSLSRRTQALPGILVGRELMKQTHLYTGEEVRVVSPLSDPANPDATGTPIPFNRDYRVAGFFFTGMYEYDLKYVYVTLDSLTDFLDRGDAIDGIEVRIGDADDTEAYVARLRGLLGPSYRIQDWKELNRSLFAALKLEKIAMFLVLGIVILVASFSIVGNLIMVVVEKAREIALLKTLGASDVSVMKVFAIQGLLIGFIGTALGISTGLAACWFAKEYGIPLNPDVYYIDRMPVHVDAGSVIMTAAAGILISMAATFYPALVAARVRPAAGMRH
jgi:lipoprotein-releasing system permease protein